MKVVVNATPLIALSLINRLDLLPALFEEIVVPRAVYEEIVVQGGGRVGAAALSNATWMQVKGPDRLLTIEPLLLGLDAGELQVLLLARAAILILSWQVVSGCQAPPQELRWLSSDDQGGSDDEPLKL